ncbi:unnamed protein product [Caenorhabditis auriculariae]|uniref:C-type lectin domain-containing protein n=1 Tax=Caenorhabditis auriculariae TaxID=2777116 RepID=A0A8S1HRS0_9PELO|nr:unnamed protein product [Caenorhabditis auriculariae]
MSATIFLFLCLPAALVAQTTYQCPDSTWKLFLRTGDRAWCIKYNDGRLIRDDAEKACRIQGGTLTGFENEEEFAYIRDTAFEAFKKFNLPDGGAYWLDGIRSPNCHGPNNNGCTRLNAFQWSNNLTQGTFAFTKCPAILTLIFRGGEENCVQGSFHYVLPDIRGHIFDFPCSEKDVKVGLSSHSAIHGYVCGTSAKKIGSKNEEEDCSPEDKEEEDCPAEDTEKGDCPSEESEGTRPSTASAQKLANQ